MKSSKEGNTERKNTRKRKKSEWTATKTHNEDASI